MYFAGNSMNCNKVLHIAKKDQNTWPFQEENKFPVLCMLIDWKGSPHINNGLGVGGSLSQLQSYIYSVYI